MSSLSLKVGQIWEYGNCQMFIRITNTSLNNNVNGFDYIVIRKGNYNWNRNDKGILYQHSFPFRNWSLSDQCVCFDCGRYNMCHKLEVSCLECRKKWN